MCDLNSTHGSAPYPQQVASQVSPAQSKTQMIS